MADGVSVSDSTGAAKIAATDELSDGQHSPKVSLLDGSTSPVPISPATSGKQDTGNSSLAAIQSSVASAATAAKQPALGVAGTASTDVITVQGIANGVVLSVADAAAIAQGVTALAKLTENSTVFADIKALLGTTGILVAANQKVTLQQAEADLSTTNRLYVETTRSQNTVTMSTVALTANTAASLMGADNARTGGRILNWTSSPVYFVKGTSGTPSSGAPSAICLAATTLNGVSVPGEYIFDYRPVDGYRVVGAASGNLTVELW